MDDFRGFITRSVQMTSDIASGSFFVLDYYMEGDLKILKKTQTKKTRSSSCSPVAGGLGAAAWLVCLLVGPRILRGAHDACTRRPSASATLLRLLLVLSSTIRPCNYYYYYYYDDDDDENHFCRY